MKIDIWFTNIEIEKFRLNSSNRKVAPLSSLFSYPQLKINSFMYEKHRSSFPVYNEIENKVMHELKSSREVRRLADLLLCHYYR